MRCFAGSPAALNYIYHEFYDVVISYSQEQCPMTFSDLEVGLGLGSATGGHWILIDDYKECGC